LSLLGSIPALLNFYFKHWFGLCSRVVRERSCLQKIVGNTVHSAGLAESSWNADYKMESLSNIVVGERNCLWKIIGNTAL
jgi:hypothetical protein